MKEKKIGIRNAFVYLGIIRLHANLETCHGPVLQKAILKVKISRSQRKNKMRLKT